MNGSQRYDMLHYGIISTMSDVTVNDDTPTMNSLEFSKRDTPFSVEKIIFTETPTPDGIAVVGRLTISSSVVTQGDEPKELIQQTIVKGINKLAASAFLHVCGFTRDDVCRFLHAEYEKCGSYTANLLLSLPNAEQTKLIRELKDENEKLRKKLRLQEVIKEIRSCLADCDEGGAK